ncbi:MAG TPA: type III glutamate--ammonia ligase, partial [Burkholderiales bacterium]|nr:type III glutamate--ammonia ligase [Burkholderiales bacterium]
MSPQAARKFLKDHHVKYILAQFVDIHGAAKAKAVPVDHLDMVLDEGAGFAGFALWGFGMGPHGPDYMAVGDLSTLSLIPWMPGFARLACYGHVNGKPYQYCSRVVLKRQLDALSKRGLTLYTGIEPEFMLLKRAADGSLAPVDDTDLLEKPCYDYKGLARSVPFLEAMVDSLKSVGIDVYQIDHEDANAQFEVNFTYGDALTSADRLVFVKMAASEIAKSMGMIATFMPKPFSNRTGTGAHFHISLGNGKVKNLF